MNFLKSRIYQTLLLVLLIISVGTSGYMLLSDYSFVDALYMTVITITTVGFSEVHPFSPEDKIFTIFLILTSITILGYAVSSFSEYLVSGKIFEHFKNKKVEKKIAQLKGHTIVCGYGRNGKQAVTKLGNYNEKCVVVERNKEMIANLDEEGILNVEGDATLDETLIDAGIQNAANLIAALPSDANNLFIVLTANQLNKATKTKEDKSNGSSRRLLCTGG